MRIIKPGARRPWPLLGAYLVWLLLAHFDVPPYAGLVVVVPAIAGRRLGPCRSACLDRRPAIGRAHPRSCQTFGLSVVIQNLPPDRVLTRRPLASAGTAGAVATASLRAPGDLSVAGARPGHPGRRAADRGRPAAVPGPHQGRAPRGRARLAGPGGRRPWVGIDARRVYASATAVAVAIARPSAGPVSSPSARRSTPSAARPS